MNLPVYSTILTRLMRGSAPASTGYAILQLRPRQSLVVRYQSVARSHHVYRFEFTGHEVVAHDLGRGDSGPAKELGKCDLSDKDLRELDRLFASFSERPAGNRAEADTIKLTVKDGRRRVRTATFVDTSSRPREEEGERFSLDRLAHRFLHAEMN